MKHLIVLAILLAGLIFGAGAPVQAQVTCTGLITRVPVGQGLPVMSAPSWTASFTGVNVQWGDLITVTATYNHLIVGDTWVATPSGWVQAYSGYTTGLVQVLLADEPCAESLPHYVGD